MQYYSLSLLFMALVCSGMEVVKIEDKLRIWRGWKSWETAVVGLDKQLYNNKAGYDLDIALHKDERVNVAAGIPTLYHHGFNASPKTMHEYIRIAGPNKIPGNVISFRFKDAADNLAVSVCNSSLGQKTDILSSLAAFKMTYDSFKELDDVCVKGWNTFGQSRGAAVVCNVLYVLNQQRKDWCEEFQSVIEDDAVRQEIIECIQRGVVVAETPMTTSRAGINAHFNRVTNFFGGLPPVAVVVATASAFTDLVVAPLASCGNYVPWGEQALSSIDGFPEGILFLVHFEDNDESVGNANDEIFLEKLRKRLGENNALTTRGCNGGLEINDNTWAVLNDAYVDKKLLRLSARCLPAHNAGYVTLLERGVISALYQRRNGSYKNDKKHIDLGMSLLPTIFVQQCENENFRNSLD